MEGAPKSYCGSRLTLTIDLHVKKQRNGATFPSAPRSHLRQHWIGTLNVINQMSQTFDEETGIAGRQTPVFGMEDVLWCRKGKVGSQWHLCAFSMMQESCWMEIEDRRIRKSMAGLDDQIKDQGSHREGCKRNFTMMGEKQKKKKGFF